MLVACTVVALPGVRRVYVPADEVRAYLDARRAR